MQLGFVGLGKMGLNIVKRLQPGGQRSRTDNTFGERLLAALSNQFGGHAVKTSQ